MPGLANPQDITLLFLLDISLPICQVVRQCLPPRVVRTWGVGGPLGTVLLELSLALEGANTDLNCVLHKLSPFSVWQQLAGSTLSYW